MRLKPILIICFALLAGCATTPAPDVSTIKKAENAILAASQMGVERDQAELKMAKANLMLAKKALSLQNYDTAIRLAEKAETEAELALAVFRKKEAAASLEEAEKANEILRKEIEKDQ